MINLTRRSSTFLNLPVWDAGAELTFFVHFQHFRSEARRNYTENLAKCSPNQPQLSLEMRSAVLWEQWTRCVYHSEHRLKSTIWSMSRLCRTALWKQLSIVKNKSFLHFDYIYKSTTKYTSRSNFELSTKADHNQFIITQSNTNTMPTCRYCSRRFRNSGDLDAHLGWSACFLAKYKFRPGVQKRRSSRNWGKKRSNYKNWDWNVI